MKLYDTYLTVNLNGQHSTWFKVAKNALLAFVLLVLTGVGVLTFVPDWQQRFFPNSVGAFDVSNLEEQSSTSGLFVPVNQDVGKGVQALSNEQKRVVAYLASRYRVSADAVKNIVQVAYHVGEEEQVAPTLILAVVGVESAYNPFAASSMGAKGLMQVMPNMHKEKFERVSDNIQENWAALNPEFNLRVGAKIIREYTQRAGSVEAGLRWYVGAAVSGEDGGYVNKVLALKTKLDAVYRSKSWVGKPEPKQSKPLETVAAQIEG